jgi:hypothetical protein
MIRVSKVAILLLLSCLACAIRADVIVLGELEPNPPRHHVRLENDVTEVSDLWYASFPEFPSLTNQDGNHVLKIRTPEETRLVTDDREGLTELGVGLAWYAGYDGTPGNEGTRANQLVLTPTVVFHDVVGTPPSPFSPHYAVFGVTENVVPFELGVFGTTPEKGE